MNLAPGLRPATTVAVLLGFCCLSPLHAPGALAQPNTAPAVSPADASSAAAPTLKGPIVSSPQVKTSADSSRSSIGPHPVIQPSGLPKSPPLTGRISKDKYGGEKNIQAHPVQVGPAPITLVQPDDAGAQPDYANSPRPENPIMLAEPTLLKGLISTDRRLNSYSLDGSYAQEVSLRNVLAATLTGNLDISNTQSNKQVQKYNFLGSLAQFLPDATGGYSLIGATGTVKTPGGALGGTAGGVQTLHIKGPFTILQAGFKQRLYQGGGVLFNAIGSKHNLNAAKKQLEGSVNDNLLKSARQYYDLLLNEALLEIRLKAVQRDEEQVRQNMQLEDNGLATNLDVLQARTQLARDRQELLTQQSNRRVSAIQLAHSLNVSLGQDLIPVDRVVRKHRVVGRELLVADLLTLAVDNRPELKQYDELRKAAKAQIIVATAPLQPQVTLGGSVFGIGTRLNDLGALYTLNFGVNWTLGNLGLKDAANIQAARWQARQAFVRANQQFVDVFEQVRTAYANTLTAEQKIEQTNEEVTSAVEELRLARLRLDAGLGTNLDVLTAQRDLTQAYVDQAQAVINFNVSQVQLAHDIGLVSVDNLSSNRPIQRTGLTAP